MEDGFVRFHHFSNKTHKITIFFKGFSPKISLFQKKGDLTFGRVPDSLIRVDLMLFHKKFKIKRKVDNYIKFECKHVK